MLQVAFPSLEELILQNCGGAVYDIWGNSGYDNVTSSFCKLKSIHLDGCEKLERGIPLAMSNNLRNLEHLEVLECPNLINVFQHFSMVIDLINLQTLNISGCEMMKVIIDGKEEDEEAEEKEEEITNDKNVTIVFPRLTTLRLNLLQCLTSFHQSGKTNPLKVILFVCKLINFMNINLGSCFIRMCLWEK